MRKELQQKTIQLQVKNILKKNNICASNISISEIEKIVEEYCLQEKEFGTDKSDIQEAYLQLLKEKEKYEKVFAASNAGITIINNAGKLIECNQAFAQMIGYTIEELINISIETITYSGDFGNDFIHASEIALKNKQTRLDKRYIHKNGSIIWCDVTTSVIEQNEGSYHYVTVVKDISLQKNAEQKLRQNEQRLELFFQQAQEGFFFMMLDQPVRWDDTVDKDAVLDYVFKNQRVTKINDSMLKQYKAKQDDFLNLTPADFFAHDIEYGKKVWKEFFNNGRLEIDTKEQKFDGTPMIVTGEYICLYDDENRIIGHFGVQRDVTNEREAEKAIKLSEEKFRTIIENSPLPITMTNEKGIITDCNQALSDLLNIPKSEIIDQDVVVFHNKVFNLDVYQQAGNNIDKKIRSLLKSNAKLPVTYITNLNLKGKEFILEQTIFSINTENGFRLASITRDITEQKVAERTIKKQKDSLERHSAEKNIFFNIIAHDLRSPFNTLLGFSKLLLDKFEVYDDDTKRKHIEKLYQSSKNTFQLTENLLTWARSQTGTTSVKQEKTEIISLVSDVAVLIKDIAEKKEIEIVNNVTQPATVFIDPNSIRTVLRNLLTNAVKFSHRKGQIIIESERLIINSQSFIRICVEDEGVGMKPEVVNNLFRLDKDTTSYGTEKEKGSGLGLLICKDFVEKNGGVIEVQSLQGKGSVFCFTMPVAEEDEQSATIENSNEIILDELFQHIYSHDNRHLIMERLEEQFNKTKQSMSSNSLNNLAYLMKELGSTSNIPGLVDYGNIIEKKTKSLDLEIVGQMLKGFEDVRKRFL
jgi:PAS domain S-box-containing protein